MMDLSDFSKYFCFIPERMDEKKTLWLVRDVTEVQAIDNSVALTSFDAEAFARCRADFQKFPAVFVAICDNDSISAVGVAEMLESCVEGLTILTPRAGAFCGCSSLCDMAAKGLPVERVLFGAEERPAAGLLDLADVKRRDRDDIPTIPSGISPLDELTGGFRAGELSVWTGKRGGGKSTILGQVLLESVNLGLPCCAYSGELVDWRFKSWVTLQAAGPEHVEKRKSALTGTEYYCVPPEVADQIDTWWRGKFFLYDNRVASANDENSILNVFQYALRRYNCSVFVVDNLMTTRFTSSSDRDYYRAQSKFVARLAEFCKKNDCHVHLVAHPRKGEVRDGDDVSGSGDIINLADNAFAMLRLEKEAAAEKGFSAGLSILKNRETGSKESISLDFDETCRRFYKAGTLQRFKKYGWEFV